jgi:transglutaminase-like putative cysteine protease
MIVNAGCKLSYNVHSHSHFQFNIAPVNSDHQNVISEELTFSAQLGYEEILSVPEAARLWRVDVPPGYFELNYRVQVQLEPGSQSPSDLFQSEVHTLPPDVLGYLNPSRYCESDRLQRFAQKQFGHFSGGHTRVTAVCNWIWDNFDYISGSTGPNDSACDVLQQRAGVCRDFAHVAIALSRALGIPARYVSGYAVNLQPPDFHGFMEAWLDGNWHLFDATRMAPLDGLVRVGTARDAADAPFASFVGATEMQSMEVWATSDSPQHRTGALVSC